jgi:methyl-accepting chemotaxis protein
MTEEVFDTYAQFRTAISRFVTGYHKSVVMNSVDTHSLEIVDHNLGVIDASLSSIVAAFEEIRATSQSTSQNAERIDTMMGEILHTNESMGVEIEKSVKDIDGAVSDASKISSLFTELKAKTESIQSITGAIQDVSDRTNILAINASIEAARAGEVGKGFRIIANEVRALANQTGDFAKQIDQNTGTFQDTVTEISKKLEVFLVLINRFKSSFGEVLANFKENAGAAHEAGEFLTQISASIREETQALTDGLQSLSSISASVKDTHAVFSALGKAHTFLDTLLDKEQ